MALPTIPATLRATMVMVNQTAVVLPGVALQNGSNNIIDSRKLQSVPQLTQHTHVFWGNFGGGGVAVYASLDQVNWYTFTAWAIAAPAGGCVAITTEGVHEFFSHSLTGTIVGGTINSCIN
jgi:hypothetical protein